MRRTELQQYLNELLQVERIRDYCPNGLQIEGRQQINTIVTGVTASRALIDKAIALKADAILVHHGYFWKNEPEVITGMKQRRIKALLQADINLFGYHLPLDVHSELGNNAQLAKVFGWPQPQILASVEPQGVVMQCELPKPVTSQQLGEHIAACLARPLTVRIDAPQPIQRIAWCTGGGQGYIDQAALAGCDAFLSGEISEQTTHSAVEQGMAYFAAGHHATERYGIKALGEHLAEKFGVTHHFIDIDNPA
ncbi:Nif3-like dinuclear metal center hexameric protein [Pseudidiomarina woesei]|uniref:GTP cyclohydrolase 1 type 2 homolog n=1 Tax=Pseudidiomarina woesei TaxID=1381080 RepID=A0A0K6GVK0_9GAMM|nr:Nif3-like dinuclear metal center hexameric protein [Pseudidiomarina woesei]CUA82553.1 dinuclear metal center protein, YbgI/SA1388 family [Pseudidiomarina woesei]